MSGEICGHAKTKQEVLCISASAIGLMLLVICVTVEFLGKCLVDKYDLSKASCNIEGGAGTSQRNEKFTFEDCSTAHSNLPRNWSAFSHSFLIISLLLSLRRTNLTGNILGPVRIESLQAL